jgi:hypothetical protein
MNDRPCCHMCMAMVVVSIDGASVDFATMVKRTDIGRWSRLGSVDVAMPKKHPSQSTGSLAMRTLGTGLGNWSDVQPLYPHQ